MKKKYTIAILLLFNILFIIIYPIYINNYIYNKVVVKLIPTNSKNINSKDTEIWLDQIIIDEKPLNFESINTINGWKKMPRIFNDGKKKMELELNLKYKKNIKFVFIKHEYSGKVEIQYNNTNKILDLYSSEQDLLEFKITQGDKNV